MGSEDEPRQRPVPSSSAGGQDDQYAKFANDRTGETYTRKKKSQSLAMPLSTVTSQDENWWAEKTVRPFHYRPASESSSDNDKDIGDQATKLSSAQAEKDSLHQLSA